MKVWSYIVWIDGYPYKKYKTIGGARWFIKRLPAEDKRTREIFITDHDHKRK